MLSDKAKQGEGLPVMPMPKRDPIFIAGPTGAGKSAVAFQVAEFIRGEIVSVDSMQVYRGLDIGTAKPSIAERAMIRHHLIDVADLDQPFDAARFVELARRAMEEIQSREHIPIFCGGTGLYFKAYLEGIGKAPPSDAKVRAELETRSLPELLAELQQFDPALLRTIDRQNRRRLVRALEVIRLTGQPFSEQRAEWSEAEGVSVHRLASTESSFHSFFGLRRAPEDLRQRIDNRVDMMFGKGLIAETQRLLVEGLARNRTAMQAIGYRQVAEHLRGERSLAETIAFVKQKTWQFARRQMTWFRHQLPVRWLELGVRTKEEDTARKIVGALEL